MKSMSWMQEGYPASLHQRVPFIPRCSSLTPSAGDACLGCRGGISTQVPPLSGSASPSTSLYDIPLFYCPPLAAHHSPCWWCGITNAFSPSKLIVIDASSDAIPPPPPPSCPDALRPNGGGFPLPGRLPPAVDIPPTAAPPLKEGCRLPVAEGPPPPLSPPSHVGGSAVRYEDEPAAGPTPEAPVAGRDEDGLTTKTLLPPAPLLLL